MQQRLMATLSCLVILVSTGNVLAKTPRRKNQTAPTANEMQPAVETKNLEIPKTEEKKEKKDIAGYKKGFYIQTPDEKFKLVFNGNYQFQLDYDRKKGENHFGFKMRRTRFIFSGHLFTKKLTYKTQLALERLDFKEVLLDALIDYKFIDEKLRVQVGQQKLPWIREQIVSSSEQQFNDRSILAESFLSSQAFDTDHDGVADKVSGNNRDIGIKVHGKVADDKLEYEVGAYNGSGPNAANFNNHLLYAVRGVYNIMGDFGYKEGDYDYSEKAALFIGASANYNVRDFTNDDILQVGAESGFKYKGFSAQGEFIMRHNNPEALDIDHVVDLAYYVQAGYFVIPKRFEVAARVSQIFFDGPDNNKSEYRLGFNTFVYKDNVKFQTDYAYLPSESANGTQNAHTVKFRLQTKF